LLNQNRACREISSVLILSGRKYEVNSYAIHCGGELHEIGEDQLTYAHFIYA